MLIFLFKLTIQIFLDLQKYGDDLAQKAINMRLRVAALSALLLLFLTRPGATRCLKKRSWQAGTFVYSALSYRYV